MHRSLLAASILLIPAVAHATLEFSGYLRSTDTLRFVLTDLESGTKSEWLTIGTIFQGHKVSAFDSEREILILEREGEAVTAEAFRKRDTAHAFFHEPYDPNKHVHETIKKLHHAIGDRA